MGAARGRGVRGTVLVFGALLALALSPGAHGASFTVTKTADTNDACLAFDCSLREAIAAANATPGQDFIGFSIGSGTQTIALDSSLPALTDLVTIDATTQPGFSGLPLIELDGAGGGVIGLDLDAANIHVKGLAVGGFQSHGIRIRATAVDTRVSLMHVGTDSTGVLDRGNGGDGIEVEGPEAQIGFLGERNRIIGNDGAGVRVVDPDAASAFVEHNVIGVSAAGVAVPNVEGVVIEAGADGALIRNNQISGNTGTGVLIRSSSDVTVKQSRIGTNEAGTAAIPNGLGIHIVGDVGAEAIGTTIGGPDPLDRNVISGNAADGILIEPFAPDSVDRTTILGNRIGTNESGTDNLSNGVHGVHVLPGVGPNTTVIGGSGAGEANTIGFNGRDGVAVEGSSRRVTIVGNELFGNGDLGIDLGDDGVDEPDAGDVDEGPNDRLNFPTLANARTAGNTIAISGVYSATASRSFQLDFYKSAACDESGWGEGRTYLGSKFVQTTPAGSIAFTASFAGTGAASEVVTATATDTDGNTSELSECIGITVGQTFVVNSAADPGAGGCDLAECTLREAITASNGTGAFDAIHFAIGSGPVTIAPGSALPGIGSQVAIDGTTQPGYIDPPIVELDGTGAGANVDGLVLFGDGSTVKGLVINGFQGSGIVLSGELGRHTVQNNFLGTDVAGTAERGNGDAGILVVSPLNLVGGTAATGNLISGNIDGIDVASDRNVIRGNRIGTDVTGTAAIPNQVGVMIDSGNDNNVIGGPDRAFGNQISGNTGAGIEIVGSTGIAIEGNLIGTDFTAEEALPNVTGIYIFQASSNTVGGALNGGAGNVISGNVSDGIRLDSLDVASANNVIAGNRIGTDANGTDPVGNGAAGVRFSQNGPGNSVVGPDAEGRNVIAFNGGEGIRVEAESQRERLLFNDIHDNDELGIDLNGDGLTPNDPVDADVGANALQNFPVVTSAVRDGNELTVEGGLNSSPNSTFTVYLFHSPTCDPSGHGEGALVMGPLPPVVTDGDGNGSFSVTVATSIPTGEAITATAVSSTGNTSEFSECRTVTSAQVLTVNSAADPGTGVCDLAECTLREAIEASNASPVQENIVFALPEPAVIQPTSALPATTDSVVIDGWTQPGAGPFAPPVVVLNGTLAGVASGLTIAGGSSIVRGLVVNGFGAASQAGILLTGGDTNLITGNYIGVNGPGPDAPGTVAVPNRYGIVVEASSSGNTISGDASTRNVVSGNMLDGIALETAGIGASTSDNSVFGNYVGTNAMGTGALGNGGTGIDVEGNNNDIGGTFAGTGNLVSGNGGTGIDISFEGAFANTVRSNLVGTDADGSSALPNQRGVRVMGDGNTVGPGNVISGNTSNGLAIGGEEQDAISTEVVGNTIGLDSAGLASLPNENGIVVTSLSDATVIGGTAPGAGNFISGNEGVGVDVVGATNAALIYGNRIGVTVTGFGEGNQIGVRLNGSHGNAIGGPTAAHGNVIADSDDANVVLAAGSSSNSVAGNWIGTDTTGTEELGALNAGVRLTGSSAGNTIGPGNVIAFNGSSFTGISISGDEAAGNAITENSIHSNIGLGIDLGDDGLTPNDDGDADTGANGLQNFPVLTAAVSAVEATFVQGTLWSNNDQTYRLEFFSNPDCDPSGNGEGETFLGSTTVTPLAGPLPFSADLDTEVPVGHVVTATATNVFTGNTSEFSACETVVSAVEAPDATVTVTADQATVEAGAGRVKLEAIPPTELLRATGAARTESAPINDVPINDVPLASPINDVPINDVGFPTVANQLGDVPLSSIPLLTPGGWTAVLAGTTLGERPLQNVTLKQAYELSPLPPQLQANSPVGIRLGQLDLSQSPLGGLPSTVILLGPTLLEDLGLTLEQWCQLFSRPPIGCSSPTSLQSSSLLSSALSGAPINDVPINDVPINDVDLAAAPINDVPINDVELENSPINDVPINDVAMSTPINDVPINDVPINDVLANGSPINDVPINDVANPAAILNCALVDCATATLGDALAARAFLAGITLGDLRAQIAPENFPYTLGDIGAWAGLTIGDLIASLPPGANITLADVLVLLLGPELFGWEQLDVDSIALQRFATGGTLAGFNGDFQLTSGTTTGAFPNTVVLELPEGFLYEPGSSVLRQLSPAGPDTPLADPAVSGRSLTYQLNTVIGTAYRIELNARPSLTLGPAAADATATPLGGATAGSPLANIYVGDTFEPNPSSAPHPIEADSFYLSYITSKDDLDFYSFPVPEAGSRVTFTLSHVPAGADYDLVVYGPPGAQLRPEIPGTPPLDGPPLEDRGAGLTHVVDALPPETLDDAALEDLPLLGVSAIRGQEDDGVVVLSGGEPGAYTIQVSGFNDTSSDEAYMLRPQVDPPRVQAGCEPRTFPSTGVRGTMPALPAGLNTVFLVNKEQLEKTYGPAAATVFASLQANQTALTGLGFPSAVIPVEADGAVATAYTEWNACPSDPRAANDVVRAIGDVVDGIRDQRPTLKYVVILGGDDIVPQARLSDFATLANEYQFADTFEPSTALGGALLNSTYLSDDPYGDIDPVPYLNRQLHVPDLALGRLVEDPVDIVSALNRFVLSGARLDPQTSFTTGYDFLTDGANRVNAAFVAEVGQANASTLINNSWTKADFLTTFLPAVGLGPDLNALNGHADPSRLQPAGGAPLIDTTDLAGANLTDRVLFSMGCHAGLSLLDVFITGANDDWAQTFAQRGAALWAANTGYGYGDTVVNAYGELLNGLFAENLVGGTMRAGEALVFAKHEYLAETGVFGVFDEKSMGELTFYGLPMYAVGTVTPLAPIAAAQSAAVEASLVDPVTGLEADEFSVTPSFVEPTPPPPRGRYLVGDDGVQVSHLRPLQPKTFVPLAGTDAHGALITELTSFDEAGFEPVFARPLVDESANEPELAFNDVAFPSKIQAVRTFKTVGGTQQRLVLVTGQFFSDGILDNQGVGIQRRFTRIGGLVYRSDSSDYIAPTFDRIEAQLVGGTAAFSVDVTDRTPSGPGQVVRVLVGFRDGSGPEWTFVDLAQTSPGTWTGGAPAAGSQIEYFVQAVDGGSGGNVAVSTNKGFYHAALPPPPPPTGGLDPDVDGEQGDNGWFTSDVSVVIGAPEGVAVEISVDDGPYVDGANATIEGDGIHTVRVRASNGGTATIRVPIDATAPDIQITVPEDGGSYDLNADVTADFACPDTGSGAVFCDGTVDDGAPIDTSSPGAKSFTVTSEDAAGNPASRTVTYTVGRRSILFSSSRTGHGDIYAVGETGSGLLRLTTHTAIDAEPAWSPDGSKIAFTSTRTGGSDIYAMNADGTNVQRLTTSSAVELSPAWSPDGTKIAFSANRHSSQHFDVYVMNANGSNVTRVTTDKKDDLLPAWSPNGQKIAFTSTRTGGSDIYVMNANGSAQTRLTTSSAVDAEPDWSPDGTKIAFSTNRHGTINFELYTMNANGSAQTRLTVNSAIDATPAWSTDGARIAFASTRNGNLELYTLDTAGAGVIRLTTNPALDATPDW
jgi:CSLREA domain-containing protein